MDPNPTFKCYSCGIKHCFFKDAISHAVTKHPQTELKFRYKNSWCNLRKSCLCLQEIRNYSWTSKSKRWGDQYNRKWNNYRATKKCKEESLDTKSQDACAAKVNNISTQTDTEDTDESMPCKFRHDNKLCCCGCDILIWRNAWIKCGSFSYQIHLTLLLQHLLFFFISRISCFLLVILKALYLIVFIVHMSIFMIWTWAILSYMYW